MKKDSQKRKKSRIFILITILLLATLVSTFFGARAIYNQGVRDGRLNYEAETTDALTALGTAISEKTEFIKNSSAILKDVPTEIESDGIDTYVDNLAKLQDSVHVETVKDVLNSYMEKWQNFKEVYASEDNNKITESFNELKTVAADLSQQIREIYDAKITTAVRELGSSD